MILMQCAVCATELGLSSGKKCGRCSTRYCGPECQVQHWKEGGHDKLCRKIKKAGGAEQYNANNKYAEAVSVAAEACAEDTKGQTCYICTQALHWKTKEGLVRGCACRGTAGFAHVTCLAEQVKILFAEAEENNLGLEVMNSRFLRWSTCSLCEQEHHGVVRCALGWACWKTFVGRPEADQARHLAMSVLGIGLGAAKRNEESLSVEEAHYSILKRIGMSGRGLLVMKDNLAVTYARLGRLDRAASMGRDVYNGYLKLTGEESRDTLLAALNYAVVLKNSVRFEAAKSLLRKTIPVARRIIGEGNELTLKMRWTYAIALYKDASATLDDLREAVTTLEEIEPIGRRVFGGAHPFVIDIDHALEQSRAVAAVHEAATNGDISAIQAGLDALKVANRKI